MANVFVKQFAEAQIIGAAILYEAPPLTVGIVQAATLTNDTAAPVAVRVHITAGGASASSSNVLVNVTVGPGKSWPCSELIGQRITPGHQIKATGPGVTIAIGGTELSGQ